MFAFNYSLFCLALILSLYQTPTEWVPLLCKGVIINTDLFWLVSREKSMPYKETRDLNGAILDDLELETTIEDTKKTTANGNSCKLSEWFLFNWAWLFGVKMHFHPKVGPIKFLDFLLVYLEELKLGRRKLHTRIKLFVSTSIAFENEFHSGIMVIQCEYIFGHFFPITFQRCTCTKL